MVVQRLHYLVLVLKTTFANTDTDTGTATPSTKPEHEPRSRPGHLFACIPARDRCLPTAAEGTERALSEYSTSVMQANYVSSTTKQLGAEQQRR